MKKHIQKWKKPKKNGLKLSLVCALNWFIGFVAKSQFYLFSAIFLGLLTYYMPHDLRQITVNILQVLVFSKCLVSLIYTVFSSDVRRMKSAVYSMVLLLFFMAGNSYIDKHTLTESMMNSLLTFWGISFVMIFLATYAMPILFKNYLLKKVINKAYLGIRKTTDPLPPNSNLYVDADEKDANKRMTMINKKVIKDPYQGIVELSFLNREVITAIGYKVVPFEKEKERIFIDDDTIYYPVFTVHPFGIREDFYHTLIELRLSRKAAFTKVGEGLLKKNF